MNIEDIEIVRKPRIVFMGTPDFSVPILDELIKNYDVKAITSLNLSANQLKDLPESLKRCKKLHNLVQKLTMKCFR